MLALVLEQILRQRNHHRSRHALRSEVEGAHHRLGDFPGVVKLEDALRHLAEEMRIIDFLEGAARAFLARYLPDEHDQRHRILLRDMHGDRAIGSARSTAHHEYGRPAGHLRFRDRHETGARLMPAHDRLDRAVMQRIEQREIAFAGHAIDAGEGVSLEGFHDEVGYAHAGPVGNRRWFCGLAMPAPVRKVEGGDLSKAKGPLLAAEGPT